MLNLAVIMGRLTATPEVKTTASNISVSSFTVAVDRYASAGKERETDFIPCVAFGRTAEFVAKYFQKGSMICVEGRIQVRSYEDRNNNRRYATEIVVSGANFTGEKRSDATAGADLYGGGAASRYDSNHAAEGAASTNGFKETSNVTYSSGSVSDFIELPGADDLPF
jgi:single-strand DNA-binding protein